MAVQTIETLKEKFKSGSFPTQQDYHDVFDSFLSKGESLTTDDIKGTGDSSELNLTQILASLDIPTVPEGLDEFIEKVNSFLEDTDVADETINKWKEIESFLSGITDTQTLTGLLADLKAEILAETNNVSNKKFCEIINDLDASDAEVGTIALYGGPTNDKYTHGFIYEKGEGGDEYIEDIIPSSFSLPSGVGGVYKIATPIQTVDSVQVTNMGINPVVLNGKFYKCISEAINGSYDEYVSVCNEDTANIIGENCLGKILIISNGFLNGPYEVEELIKEEAGASWIPLNVMNVIN